MRERTGFIGKRFGRLKVVGEAGIRKYKTQTKRYYFCACDCGKQAVKVRSDHLKYGSTISCGCAGKENSKTHGKTKTRVYRIWYSMTSRALNRAGTDLKTYGKIGICDRWLDFKNFYMDMGDPPSSKHTIDRIDNEKGYYRDNCRWATMREQMLNTSRSAKTYKLYKSFDAKVPYNIFRRRVNTDNWDIEKAALTPKMKNQFG